jgi:hypothetical protein
MANRVTADDVKLIFDTNMADANLTACITSANALINSQDEMTDNLSDALLIEIERWLSAHFASAYDQRISYQKIGEASFKFQGEYKQSFYATDYGQRAIDLDSTGTLRDMTLGLQQTYIDIFEVDYPTTYADVVI